jgi:hypothetical protein
LKLPADANTAIYDNFNSKYRSGGNAPVPANVDYAVFRQTYNHVNINGINYTGIRELPMIHHPLPELIANEILIGHFIV